MAGLTDKIKAWINKPQNHFELAADILCLAASYGLLFLMPQRVNLLFGRCLLYRRFCSASVSSEWDSF